MKNKHLCEGTLPKNGYGEAIYRCAENDGELWISNGEYASQVSFCPYCGFAAPKAVSHKAN